MTGATAAEADGGQQDADRRHDAGQPHAVVVGTDGGGN
jgi:hypothetical protein